MGGKFNPAQATRQDFNDLFGRMTNEQILNRFASVWANMAIHGAEISQIDGEVTEARGGYSSLDARLDAMTPGSGGTTDYTELDNKPSIAGTTLVGNKTLADLGIAAASDLSALQTTVGDKADASDLTAETTARTTADTKITAALAALIDSGAKNRMPLNAGTTPASGTDSGYLCKNLPISMPAGTYRFMAERETAGQFTVVIKDASDNELFRWSRASGITDVNEEFTTTATAATISIFVGQSTTVTNVMICSKVDYDISQAYVPYRPSWQEMYDMILALQPSNSVQTRIFPDRNEGETKSLDDQTEVRNAKS